MCNFLNIYGCKGSLKQEHTWCAVHFCKFRGFWEKNEYIRTVALIIYFLTCLLFISVLRGCYKFRKKSRNGNCILLVVLMCVYSFCTGCHFFRMLIKWICKGYKKLQRTCWKIEEHQQKIAKCACTGRISFEILLVVDVKIVVLWDVMQAASLPRVLLCVYQTSHPRTV